MSFELFWKAYPRKVGRFRAEKIWSKLHDEEQKLAIERLALWKQTEQWHSSGGKFIPHGSTFLAQRRWEDEPWMGAFEEQP